MPFRSKAQMRAAFGGYLGPEMKSKADEFAKATPDLKDLPEHVKKDPPMNNSKMDNDGDEPSGKLTYAERKSLPSSAFVFPKERKYPIHDITHARNALARVARNGTPEEVTKVRAAVRRRYPNIKVSL